MRITLFLDEILLRYFIAILCTMFHRYGLYRAELPCKLICYIIVHDDSPFRALPLTLIILHQKSSVNPHEKSLLPLKNTSVN